MSQRCHVDSGEITTTAATTLTLVQIAAPSNIRLDIARIDISGKGIVSTNGPALVEVLRQTSAGGTATATPTPTKFDDATTETVQTTALTSPATEPSAGDVLEKIELHPQGGRHSFVYNRGEFTVKGGGRLGVRITDPAGGQKWVASITFWE